MSQLAGGGRIDTSPDSPPETSQSRRAWRRSGRRRGRGRFVPPTTWRCAGRAELEWITRNPRRVAAGPRLYRRCLTAQRTPEAGSSRWPIDHAGRAEDRSVSCGPRNSSVTGRAVTIAVGVVYTRPSPASSNGVACRGAYPDHTHAELRQTQPSRVSASRVCVPQVGHAIGAPILSNFVASAESSGAARRGPRGDSQVRPLGPGRLAIDLVTRCRDDRRPGRPRRLRAVSAAVERLLTDKRIEPGLRGGQ